MCLLSFKECVPEDRTLKRDVWKTIDDAISSDDIILASSTSAIVPSLLSDHLKRKDRFMVAHPVSASRHIHARAHECCDAHRHRHIDTQTC